jgi:hypothetical protein
MKRQSEADNRRGITIGSKISIKRKPRVIYRRVQKSVANHVIGPPGPSQFHSFVAIAPTLYGNSTNLWIRLFSLSLNLVGVDSMPLDLRYSNSARCAVETCLPINGPPQITDEVRVSNCKWVISCAKMLEAFDNSQPLLLRIGRVSVAIRSFFT